MLEKHGIGHLRSVSFTLFLRLEALSEQKLHICKRGTLSDDDDDDISPTI